MDENDNVYITGRTTSTAASDDIVFPCDVPTNGGLPQCDDGGYYQATNNGGVDGFLYKFTSLPTSFSLVHGTYFGGDGDDEVTNVKALGASEQFYIIGNSTSETNSDNSSTCAASTNNGFPLCNPGVGAYYQDIQTSPPHEYAFISKFKSSGGTALAWSTIFGGGADKSFGIDIDVNQNVYIVGETGVSTLSTNNCGVPAVGEFPVCDPGGVFYQSSYGGGTSDAYIAKFNPNHELVWGSLMGGSDRDQAFSIALSDAGYSYITGVTWSATGFPLMDRWNTYYQDLLTSRGPYVLSFDPTNNQGWGTYFNATFGGSTTDTRGAEVAVFQDSKLFLTGTSHVIGNFDDSWGDDHDWPIRCSPTLGHWCGKKGSPTDGFIAQFDLSTVTGIEDTEYNTLLDNLLVYPNPTNDLINVKFKSDRLGDVFITVYNILGELVYDNQFKNAANTFQQELSFASYSKGMYLITVQIDGHSYSKKILYQ